MLLCELDPNTDLKDVDLLDDLHFFMTNDSKFYRDKLLKCIVDLKKHITADQPCDHSIFITAVDEAVEQYCKKFKIDGNQASVFTGVDRDELARKIFDQESEHIKSNTKKKSEEGYFFESNKELHKSLDAFTGSKLRSITKSHPHERGELAAFIADTEERLEHLEIDQQFDKSELKALKTKIQALMAASGRIKK